MPSSPTKNPSAPVHVGPFRGTGEEWDRFVVADPGSTVCHLWEWRSIMEDVLGHRCRFLSARGLGADGTDGQIRGVLPLVEVRSLLTGHFLVSLPFLNDGGPLGDPATRRALSAAARDEAERLQVDLMELRAREAVPSDLRVSDRRITVVLPLPSDAEILWKDHFGSKLRNQIRRPQKAGMELRIGPGELAAFYSVFSRTMHDLGTPVLPREMFERIRDVLSSHTVFAAVYRDGVPVAAGCGFRWKEEFEITWAGFLREHGRESPNMLLYWGLMEHMIEEGATAFNFGRCTPGSGTHRFKRQWGGEDVPLPWLQWARGDVAGTPDESRAALRLASRAWRRVPLSVANQLGPFLARRLP